MRFNELIAGVRGDVAVKVFGDDFDAMLRRPREQIARGAARTSRARPTCKVEQVDGRAGAERRRRPRRRSRATASASPTCRTWSAIAVGGRDGRAGLRGRPPLRHRRAAARARSARIRRRSQHLPIPLLARGRAARRAVALAADDVRRVDAALPAARRRGATSSSPRARTRSAARTASAASSCRPTCAAATSARSSPRRRRAIAARGDAAARQLARLGRPVREPGRTRAQRLTLVVPVCFLLIFLLLYGTLRLAAPTRCSSSPACRWRSPAASLALWLRGMPFSISAAVGFIALSGVAVLNGLVHGDASSTSSAPAGVALERRDRATARSRACGRC